MKINELIKEAYLSTSSDEYRKFLLKEAEDIKKFNISNDNYLIYHYAKLFANKLLKTNNIAATKSNVDFLIKYALEKYNTKVIDPKKMYELLDLSIKTAYPNTDVPTEPLKRYNLDKWIKAYHRINFDARLYKDRRYAIDKETKEWDNMDEKLDFEKWLRFQQFEAGKYKVASLPIQAIPGLPLRNEYKDPEPFIRQEPKSYKPLNNYEIKHKVLGRINSIKKILSTREGMQFIGSDYKRILQMLLDLERDILNTKTACMIEDIIKRATNIMEKEFPNSNIYIKEAIVKIAQIPTIGEIGGSEEKQEPVSQENPEEGKKAIEEFIAGNQGFSSTKTTPEGIEETFDKIIDDYKKSWVYPDTKEIIVLSQIVNKIKNSIYDYKEIRKLAQVVPSVPAATPQAPAAAPASPTPAPVVKPIEQSPDSIKPEEPVEEAPKKKKNDITPEELTEAVKNEKINLQQSDDTIDRAFSDIKVSDVIKRLTDLSRVFKNREIARQLAIVDLMLDKLGLSGFFPALAEATKSALESNQYCLTRVEEILSKLTSATDEAGNSLIENTGIQNKTLVDKEMEEPNKPIEQPKPEPKPEEQTPDVNSVPTTPPATV